MNRILIAAAFLVSTLLTCALAPSVASADPSFSNLSQTDYDNIVRDLSANGAFHSVTPPSSMGQILGIEVGLAAGITKTPHIDELVRRNGGDGMDMFPHAGLLGVLSTPLGFTGEVVFVPKIEASGVKYSTAGFAVKWVPTDKALPLLPINIAVRAFYSKNSVSYSQTVTDVQSGITADSEVDYTGNVYGAQLLVSPKLIPILEPYIGVGQLKGEGRMHIAGNSSFFNFTDSQSATSFADTTQFLAGLDVRLLLIGLGVEYSRAFKTESVTAKLSFKF